MPALALLLAGAGLALALGSAWPFPAGLALAAGAPLAFVIGRTGTGQALCHHPLVISVLSGLGCVTIMIGSQRFGAGSDWTLPAALAALIIWMLWQRGERRRDGV